MIINGRSLVTASPIKDMLKTKWKHQGVSHGLAEAGYDVRIKQDILFRQRSYPGGDRMSIFDGTKWIRDGRFTLASTVEEFEMPPNMAGVVHDKSTWARQGLSVFNTVIEPGWKGFLTLELVYHGQHDLHIAAGSGIAQVLFHQVVNSASYTGKYQNQADEPVSSVF